MRISDWSSDVCSSDLLPAGEAWAYERVELITHNGTHLDAPYHYASTMDHGRRAITINEVPLEWCLQPAVKLDFTTFDVGYVEIGRASCRERVWQFISISVFAFSLKYNT